MLQVVALGFGFVAWVFSLSPATDSTGRAKALRKSKRCGKFINNCSIPSQLQFDEQEATAIIHAFQSLRCVTPPEASSLAGLEDIDEKLEIMEKMTPEEADAPWFNACRA